MANRLADWVDNEGVKPLTAEEFQQIRDLAHRTFGLDLKSGKEELVSSRLRRLVRGGGFRSFDAYFRSIVRDTTGASLLAMIDALATNHTAFLREPEHFNFLRDTLAPSLALRDRVDLWCAACSTGEEVWTLAMVLDQAIPRRPVRIVASDISNKALDAARRAVYPDGRCQGIPDAWVSRYFSRDPGSPGCRRVAARLRAMASFRRINLVEPYCWPQPFPVIFCRNVMIYFDAETQERVVARLTDQLEPGGYLFVGHAESLARIRHSLEYVCPAVYRKPAREAKWNKSR